MIRITGRFFIVTVNSGKNLARPDSNMYQNWNRLGKMNSQPRKSDIRNNVIPTALRANKIIPVVIPIVVLNPRNVSTNTAIVR